MYRQSASTSTPVVHWFKTMLQWWLSVKLIKLWLYSSYTNIIVKCYVVSEHACSTGNVILYKAAYYLKLNYMHRQWMRKQWIQGSFSRSPKQLGARLCATDGINIGKHFVLHHSLTVIILDLYTFVHIVLYSTDEGPQTETFWISEVLCQAH